MERCLIYIVSFQVFAMMYMDVVYWNLVFQDLKLLFAISSHFFLSFLICNSPNVYIYEVCMEIVAWNKINEDGFKSYTNEAFVYIVEDAASILENVLR